MSGPHDFWTDERVERLRELYADRRRSAWVTPRALPKPLPPIVITLPDPIGPLQVFPERHACKYIHGDPQSEWRCCGHPALDGLSPYCGAHRAICYTVRPRRSRTSEDLAMERRSGLSKTFGGM